jgi:hypothetical protein
MKLGGKASAADTQSALHLGSVLSSMISSGLKDEQKDAFQIWREVRELRLIQADSSYFMLYNIMLLGAVLCMVCYIILYETLT